MEQIKVIKSNTEPNNKNALWLSKEGLKEFKGNGWEVISRGNSESGSGGGSSMININYTDLVDLRNNSKLIPGQQYRIIDYVATTTDPETKSANHPFDIIVTADDNKTLNENARAIQHEGDEYFNSCNLAAWKLKYCLDNDDYTYSWAKSAQTQGIITKDNDGEITTIYCKLISENDTTYEGFPYVYDLGAPIPIMLCTPYKEFNTPTICKQVMFKGQENEQSNDLLINNIVTEIIEGGKGVVYEMIDEFKNRALFDFKGLQIKRYKVITSDKFPNIIGQYCNNGFYKEYTVDLEDYQYKYLFNTFTDQNLDATADADLLKYGMLYIPHNCNIEGFITNNIVCNVNLYDLTNEYHVGSFTIKSDNFCLDIGNCHNFTIDYDHDSLIIQDNCNNFNFGVGGVACVIGNNNYSWSIGANCTAVYIKQDCGYWSIGHDCRYIYGAEHCSDWSCGNGIEEVSWDANCSYFHILNGVRSGVGNRVLYLPFKPNTKYSQYAAFKTKDNVSTSDMEVVVFNIADLVQLEN